MRKYIDEIKAFYKKIEENPLSTGQIALWHALMYIDNKTYWAEWFSVANTIIEMYSGLSRTGIQKARNELKKMGFIDFKPNGTKATLYKITILDTETHQDSNNLVAEQLQSSSDLVANQYQDSVQVSNRKETVEKQINSGLVAENKQSGGSLVANQRQVSDSLVTNSKQFSGSLVTNSVENGSTLIDKDKDKRLKTKTKELKDVSSEPEEIPTPEPTSPTVAEIVLNDKSKAKITQAEVDEWKKLYPAVDVLQELRKMTAWCEANPTKRKTKRGIKAFIVNWLNKEQDRGKRGDNHGGYYRDCTTVAGSDNGYKARSTADEAY